MRLILKLQGSAHQVDGCRVVDACNRSVEVAHIIRLHLLLVGGTEKRLLPVLVVERMLTSNVRGVATRSRVVACLCRVVSSLHLSILSCRGVSCLVVRSLRLEHARWGLCNRLRSCQLLNFEDVTMVVMVEVVVEVLLLILVVIVHHILSHDLGDVV